MKILELEQMRWNAIMTTFVELKNIQRPRCCIPSSHELRVDSVVLNSVWQTGLPWMRLNTENMPLLTCDQLRVENLVRTRSGSNVMILNLRKTWFTSLTLVFLLGLGWPGCRST